MKFGKSIAIAFASLVFCMNGTGASYSLDLSGVTQRQHMQDWDPAWISEVEYWFFGFEFQVDPGNGGQVGVWAGSGNPSTAPSNGNVDYSQFIAAGPSAGMPVRVRIKYEHQDSGVWVSSSHGNDTYDRHHYEVSMQGRRLHIYKFWGPTRFDYGSVYSKPFTAVPGNIYWIYMTEIREGNAADGPVTISGELRDEELNILETISITDSGNLAGGPPITSTDKRGFGGYFPADGSGAKIFEWHVEPLITPLSYDLWQETAFLPESPSAQRLAGANPDDDFLPNALEFYLGLDPLVPDLNPVTLHVDGDIMVAEYSRPIGRQVSLAEVQYTSDFSEWSAEAGEETVANVGGGRENVHVTFPASNVGFVRLAVQP